MANYLNTYLNISKPTAVYTQQNQTAAVQTAPVAVRTQAFGSNVLERFLQNKGVMAASQVNVVNAPKEQINYKNDLRTKFQNNEATIMGVIIRSLGAKDNVGNQLIREGDVRGTFINAVDRLDELKDLGINTLHVLPINPPGKKNAFGTAGSVYAPADLLSVDPALVDKNDPRTPDEQFKYFSDECHKRGISVMLDLPSCASYDLFLERPDLMAFEKDGTPKTPQGWNDIRMFDPWADETKRELNKNLLDYHIKFVDKCVKDWGVDGIRSDVARTKPTEFWHTVIDYSRKLDPQFAWLAESYTYEDASPQLNMNYDRPEDSLRAGFDSYYGQYHIFHEWSKAKELLNYVKENINMTENLEPGKSLIGSFGTHDDISIMNHGGVTFTNLVSGLQATLPMLNPYYFDGYQSGDDYIYDFENTTDKETVTDSEECTVHRGRPDIFNLSRPLIGKHPECGDFMKNTLQVRSDARYKDILTKGSFIPLNVDRNKNDQIIAFARHYNGRTLLVVANRDVNARQSGIVEVPGLDESQKLSNLFMSYGDNSEFQTQDGKLIADLGPGRVHLFEINTPDIEISDTEVLKQKL